MNKEQLVKDLKELQMKLKEECFSNECFYDSGEGEFCTIAIDDEASSYLRDVELNSEVATCDVSTGLIILNKEKALLNEGDIDIVICKMYDLTQSQFDVLFMNDIEYYFLTEEMTEEDSETSPDYTATKDEVFTHIFDLLEEERFINNEFVII